MRAHGAGDEIVMLYVLDEHMEAQPIIMEELFGGRDCKTASAPRVAVGVGQGS